MYWATSEMYSIPIGWGIPAFLNVLNMDRAEHNCLRRNVFNRFGMHSFLIFLLAQYLTHAANEMKCMLGY
jgi:hypothetical protein